MCKRVTTITTCQTVANKIRQEMIKQGHLCVFVCAFVRDHYHSSLNKLIYSCISLTDIHSGTLEYFLDEHMGKGSINTFLASYPSCEVVSAWYRLLPVG